jgi:hypothetical protein
VARRSNPKPHCLTFLACLFTFGCATTDDGAGSETHLVRCSSDAECGEGGPGWACVEGECVTWIGAPCEECDIRTQAARLAGGATEDCGSSPLDAGADGADCARAAFQAERPFTWILEEAGFTFAVEPALPAKPPGFRRRAGVVVRDWLRRRARAPSCHPTRGVPSSALMLRTSKRCARQCREAAETAGVAPRYFQILKARRAPTPQ